MTLLMLNAASAGGPPTVKPGATFPQFHESGDVLCVPPYGTIDVDGSGGKVVVNQPNGEVSAVVTTIANGLLPNRTYTVYLMNYGVPGADRWEDRGCSYGPWTAFGTFTTDADGHGDFHINILGTGMSPGTYQLSVWINDTAKGLTLLVSDSFEVVIDIP